MTERNSRVTEGAPKAGIELATVGLGDVEVVGGIGLDNGNNRTEIAAEQITSTDPEDRYPAGNSSIRGAIANFVNTIVGAGIVGLPFALREVWRRLQLVARSAGAAAALRGYR